MINSLESLEISFKGEKITQLELNSIKSNRVAPYYGKYIFNIIREDGSKINGCFTYLEPNTLFDNSVMTLSPQECNNNPVSMELVDIYKFEGGN